MIPIFTAGAGSAGSFRCWRNRRSQGFARSRHARRSEAGCSEGRGSAAIAGAGAPSDSDDGHGGASRPWEWLIINSVVGEGGWVIPRGPFGSLDHIRMNTHPFGVGWSWREANNAAVTCTSAARCGDRVPASMREMWPLWPLRPGALPADLHKRRRQVVVSDSALSDWWWSMGKNSGVS